MIVLTTLGIEWFRLDVLVDRLVSRGNEFDELFIVLNMPDPFHYSSIFGWYTAAHFGFLILSAGLLLLYITAIRSKAFPVWVSIILLISTLSIHLPSLLNALPLISYELEVMIYRSGPSTVLLI